MRKPRRFLSDDRGAIAVIFGILLPVLVGMSALGIEVGYWYSERDKLQIAADTAAYSALVSFSIDSDLNKAIRVGVAEAQASGFSGSAGDIAIAIPSPDGTLGPNSSRAVLHTDARLFLSNLFLNSGSIGISVTAFATMDEVEATSPCMLALKTGQSRSIVIASSVQVSMNCTVAANSGANDAIWAEGTATLTAECASTPGTIGTNGGAWVKFTDCPDGTYLRDTFPDSFDGTPYWGSASVPNTGFFVDQAISQGRYGVGMPGGNVLQPGKYGKQVEIDGTVTLLPGVYYFSNGFRAAPGSKISGAGVTIYVDQSKVLDIAQNVAWDLSAPTSGPTQGIAIMGNPAILGGSVRLIGIIGNVQGAVYFPNQTLQTENGPNLATARCTQIVANLIDIRGSGTIANDCNAGSGNASSGAGKVRLAQGPT